MKILNLYAGIGGNRKLWGNGHEITAVEYDPTIAAIYKDFFPGDNVIVADAHQYLLEHYSEFDFIWSSPPCPSHSRFRWLWKSDGKNITGNKKSGSSMMYPDMKLYEEIIFLQHFFDGKYCVENVISYYKPLVLPQEINNHYFWANFKIGKMYTKTRHIRHQDGRARELVTGYNLDKYELNARKKKKLLNNCVEPDTGLTILESALNIFNQNKISQIGLFK